MPAERPTYFRWIAKGPDLAAARLKALQVSAAPRNACWIFRLGDRVSGAYMPSFQDRVLVALVISAAGEAILQDQSRWVRFPDAEFKGEAQHPDKIIVKTNEPGAYGIGRDVLPHFNRQILETRPANRQEMSKVLGRSVPQSQVNEWMKNQKWPS